MQKGRYRITALLYEILQKLPRVLQPNIPVDPEIIDL
jgi:hypothetical protein